MAGLEFRIRERERCRADGSYGERRDRSDATIESMTMTPANIFISRLLRKSQASEINNSAASDVRKIQDVSGFNILR